MDEALALTRIVNLLDGGTGEVEAAVSVRTSLDRLAVLKPAIDWREGVTSREAAYAALLADVGGAALSIKALPSREFILEQIIAALT